MALHPEIIRDPLLEGVPPATLLDRIEPQPPLIRCAKGSQEGLVASQAERLASIGARVLPLPDPAYPPALAELPDAPAVLVIRGDPAALCRPSVAIVGARAATLAARATAQRLARELAQAGFGVVSGLARGIDGEAHRGALAAHGCTVGVLACGLEQIYPPEHRGLADRMTDRGAVVSELPVGAPPRRSHFPLRNRIISGLCLGVVVVEARRRSGSLITVRHALAQGREVFVVPGAIDGPFAEGGNQLLRDGARPIRCARDIIEDLGLADTLGQGPAASRLSSGTTQDFEGGAGKGGGAEGVEARVLAVLRAGPATRDEMLIQADLDARRLATVLLELQLDGRVVEERDGRFHACWSA
jgi:DNA processing protein